MFGGLFPLAGIVRSGAHTVPMASSLDDLGVEVPYDGTRRPSLSREDRACAERTPGPWVEEIGCKAPLNFGRTCSAP
jgi:hypothetical protein